MWEGKVQSHKVCSTFYWYTSFIQCLKLSQKSCRSSCLESKGMGYLCIYHHYSPWSTPFLSLNSHSPHDFFLPFIFSLCQVSSSIFMLYHLWSSFSAIRPQPWHPSCRCTICPTPSVHHLPSFTVPQSHHPCSHWRHLSCLHTIHWLHRPSAHQEHSWRKFDFKWVEYH